MTIPIAEFRDFSCACCGLLGPLGDHRAACATSGALECAAARVCQEAGAPVAHNVRLADMNLPPRARRAPDRDRLQRLAPFAWGSLAVDTTCVMSLAPASRAATSLCSPSRLLDSACSGFNRT